MNETEVSLICKALADRTRLKIVRLLAGGEMCACKLLECLSVTQPTLSHHMKVLCDCGLVTARRDGRWSYYTLNCETLAAFQDFIKGLDCCAGQPKGGCCHACQE